MSSVRSQVSSDQQSPWQYDVYRYPDNMTIVAQVADVEEQVTVGAFCGDECRGIGRWVNDKLFIGVQGSASSDEVISFRCYDSTTDNIVPVAETILFDGDSHGSLAAPIRDATGHRYWYRCQQCFRYVRCLQYQWHARTEERHLPAWSCPRCLSCERPQGSGAVNNRATDYKWRVWPMRCCLVRR